MYSASLANSKEEGAVLQAIAAQQQAAYGNARDAQQLAAAALRLAPTSQGAEVEAAFAFAMAADTKRAESLAQDLGQRFPLDTQMQSLWLPAIHAQLALDKKNTALALNVLQTTAPIELGQIQFRDQSFLPLSRVCARRGILGSQTGQCCRRGVSEDSRSQRHRLELLDRSVSAPGSGSRQCVGVEKLAWCGC